MMKLIFDTETTGLARPGVPLNLLPRLVQIAGVLVDADWIEQGCFSFLIKPNGFEIPANAFNIHGITTEKAAELGISLATALSVFNDFARVAAEIWAFNAAFDVIVMKSEYDRANRPCVLNDKAAHCAMLQCVNICKLPGRRGYKWPKLSEAYGFFFDGATFDNAHNALADVRATAQIMEATAKYKEVIL